MYKLKVEITFLEETLGSAASNLTIADEHVIPPTVDAEKRKEELQALANREGFEFSDDFVEEPARDITVFARDENGNPHAWDYQVKGMFKDTCGMLRKVPGTYSSKIKAYKKEIDGLIFVSPRKIPYDFDGEMGICTRPLRASTPQGERIALAASETIPAGAKMTFEITCLLDSHAELVKEWLNYGELRGFSQWRNSGKGRFTWRMIDECYIDSNGNKSAKKTRAKKAE